MEPALTGSALLAFAGGALTKLVVSATEHCATRRDIEGTYGVRVLTADEVAALRDDNREDGLHGKADLAPKYS